MNQKLINCAFLVIISCALLTSCVPGTIIPDPYTVSEDRQKENIYYVPSAPNTPLATEKNDIGLNMLHSSGTKFSGFDFQASYLPSKHIGIIGSYSFANNGGGYPDYMKFIRTEFGAGYITGLRDGWHFETYAGVGAGTIDNYHYSGSSQLKLTHFFIQPAIAISNEKKTYTLAFISRFSGVNIAVKDTSFQTDREPFSTAQLQSLYNKPFQLMWEPGLVLRAGWKNVKFHASYTFSSDLTNSELHRSTNNLSIGIAMLLNTEQKKKVK